MGVSFDMVGVTLAIAILTMLNMSICFESHKVDRGQGNHVEKTQNIMILTQNPARPARLQKEY